jgi:hypothetical protein
MFVAPNAEIQGAPNLDVAHPRDGQDFSLAAAACYKEHYDTLKRDKGS